MATKELIMIDELLEDNIDDNEFVTIVISDECIVVKNILSIPRDQALSYATNMLVQLELIND